jgi:GT2 family glycosyltransferase
VSDRPEVAVAVVSWNTRELLGRCLDALRVQEGVELETWVVDNGSTDGSRELVRERYGWARLVEADENLGFGRAVNLVAERTDSPWLAMANADVAPRPRAVAVLLEAGARDPGAGAVAPRLVLPDGETQHSVFGMPTLAFTFILQSGLFHVSRELADRLALLGHWDTERERRVPWAVGAFLLVRREAWEQTGGFDPHQWMYAEDLDLGWKLRRAGWATRYVPRAVVDHENGASTRQTWGEPARIEEQWQRATYGWMARRRGIARTWATAAMNWAGALVRWALLTPLAWARPVPWAGRRDALWRWVRIHRAGLASRRDLEEMR